MKLSKKRCGGFNVKKKFGLVWVATTGKVHQLQKCLLKTVFREVSSIYWILKPDQPATARIIFCWLRNQLTSIIYDTCQLLWKCHQIFNHKANCYWVNRFSFFRYFGVQCSWLVNKKSFCSNMKIPIAILALAGFVFAAPTDRPQEDAIEADNNASNVTKDLTSALTETDSNRAKKSSGPKTVCFEMKDVQGSSYLQCAESADSESEGTQLYPQYSPAPSPAYGPSPSSSYGSAPSSGYGASAYKVRQFKIIKVCYQRVFLNSQHHQLHLMPHNHKVTVDLRTKWVEQNNFEWF